MMAPMFRRAVFVRFGAAIFLIAILSVSFWKFARNKKPNSAEIEIEQLQALPYTQWSDRKADPKQNGVKILDAAQVSPGYNLYTDGVNIAYLMDIQGHTLRSWKLGRN